MAYINVASKNLATAVAKWRNAAQGSVVEKILTRNFRRVGIRLKERIRSNLDNVLLRRITGRLWRSAYYRVEGTGNLVAVFVGVDLQKAPYGRIQEVGGVIQRSSIRTGNRWSITIKPVHFIRTSRQQEESFIQEQLNTTAKSIAKDLLKDGTSD